MDRRHFLQLFSLAPASVAAAESLTERVNLAETPEQIENSKRIMADVIGMPRPGDYTIRKAHADYDLMHIPEGTLVPDSWWFFTQPIGSPTMGRCHWCHRIAADEARPELSVPQYTSRTVLHTSQLRANSFPPPQTRCWDSLVFVFSPRMDEEDRLDLVSNFWFQLRLDDRIYAQGPLARCRVVGILDDLVEVDTLRHTEARKAVALDAPFSIPFIKPLYLAPLQHFSLTLHGHSFVSRKTIEVYAFLDGIADFQTQ